MTAKIDKKNEFTKKNTIKNTRSTIHHAHARSLFAIASVFDNNTVKATALELGFPNTGNFCRYFKRITGIYPQEYKKQNY